MLEQEHKQYIYGLCDPGETGLLYIGRAKNAGERLRQHVQLSEGDFSPKGIWVKYLKLEGFWPNQIILEEAAFENEEHAEKWAKQCEKQWIKKSREDGEYLFNDGCWWHHPERKKIPKSTRFAWQQLHALAHDWWTLEKFSRIRSGDPHVRKSETEATLV